MMTLAKVKMAAIALVALAAIGEVAWLPAQLAPASAPAVTVATTKQGKAQAPLTGEYYLGGDVPVVGVWSLGGQHVTLLQALVNSGINFEQSAGKMVHVNRTRADGSPEMFYRVSMRELIDGSADLVLELNDVIQVMDAQIWIAQRPTQLNWEKRYVSGVARSGAYYGTSETQRIWALLVSAGYVPEDGAYVTIYRRSPEGDASLLHRTIEEIRKDEGPEMQAMPGDVIMVRKKPAALPANAERPAAPPGR